jgi:hypothetical protein
VPSSTDFSRFPVLDANQTPDRFLPRHSGEPKVPDQVAGKNRCLDLQVGGQLTWTPNQEGKRQAYLLLKEFALWLGAAYGPGLGGQKEVLNLYSEAIAQMNRRQRLPRCSMNIFKALTLHRPRNATGPFKVNAFSYDHSERLDDASGVAFRCWALGERGPVSYSAPPD